MRIVDAVAHFVSFNRPVLTESAPKRNISLRSHVRQTISNTFTSSQLRREPGMVRALLRQTAVDQLIKAGVAVA